MCDTRKRTTLFTADNSDSEQEIKVNASYANKYNDWRQKEELHKLKTKYGHNDYPEVAEESADSSTTEEDENTSVLAKQFDKEFYRTLAYLKKKDARIYNEGTVFFNDIKKVSESQNTENHESRIKQNNQKGLFLRDYERKIMLERHGILSDSEDESSYCQKDRTSANTFTYAEEQCQLKESFKNALLDKEEETEDSELLKVKHKTSNELEREEDSYKVWLKGQRSEIEAKEQQELQPLRDFWTDPNLDEKEKFLRDYVLNNRYIGQESSNANLDYDCIVHDSDENLSEDERNIEKQEEFEHKYNFRFEEPDTDFIKRYPRTMENSMRKKDTRRAQKRAEVKERKEEEKVRKREELKQLKALKRKEIEEKIAKLKEITGNDDVYFGGIDFESDFDPAEHDRKMTEIFNEEYYTQPEETAKPEFPDIDEELEIESTWDDYVPNASENSNGLNSTDGPHCEDADFNMDAEYDESKSSVHAKFKESTRRRKRKRSNKFADLIAKEKPKFDPKLYPSYEKYFDQYYSLDYEDMIGDLPCRFKYRKVIPNDYGLSVEEILMADDKELNKWCSLKRALRHKPENVEHNDVRMYREKATNETLKRKILKSLYETSEKEEEERRGTSVVSRSEEEKIKKKNGRKKMKANANHASTAKSNSVGIGDAHDTRSADRSSKASIPKDKTSLRRKRKAEEGNDGHVNDQLMSLGAKRLKTYGINAKRFKNKLAYGKKK